MVPRSTLAAGFLSAAAVGLLASRLTDRVTARGALLVAVCATAGVLAGEMVA